MRLFPCCQHTTYLDLGMDMLHIVSKGHICKCGAKIPEQRWKLGYTTCVNCSTEKKYRRIEIPASSLQWI